MLYVLIALWADARELVEHTTSIDPWVFIAALSLSLVNYSIRYAKWVFYLRLLHIEVPHKINVVTFLAGFSMAVTPGKVGEVIKSLLLRRAIGVSIERTAPIVLAERLTDLLGLVVIASFGAFAFEVGVGAVVGIFGLLVSLALVLQRPTLVHAIFEFSSRVDFGRRVRPRLEEAYASTRVLLAGWPMVISVALSVLSWSMEAYAFYLIVDSMGGQMSVSLAMFVFSLTTVLGALSFLPGGLGVTEGTMLGMLMSFGVFAVRAPAVASTYVIRFTTLWFAVVLGGIALWVHRRWFGSEPSTPES